MPILIFKNLLKNFACGEIFDLTYYRRLAEAAEAAKLDALFIADHVAIWDTFESNVASGTAWVGTPKQIRRQIADYCREVGDFEIASLQVNFNTIGYADAKRSMKLFAKKVMPKFS